MLISRTPPYKVKKLRSCREQPCLFTPKGVYIAHSFKILRLAEIKGGGVRKPHDNTDRLFVIRRHLSRGLLRKKYVKWFKNTQAEYLLLYISYTSLSINQKKTENCTYFWRFVYRVFLKCLNSADSLNTNIDSFKKMQVILPEEISFLFIRNIIWRIVFLDVVTENDGGDKYFQMKISVFLPENKVSVLSFAVYKHFCNKRTSFKKRTNFFQRKEDILLTDSLFFKNSATKKNSKMNRSRVSRRRSFVFLRLL